MTAFSRVLTAIAALALIVSVYQPIWKIDLTAPQYPEGLSMNIWANKLGGDVEIINGLNHYIGMKTLHADEFIEFTVLPYIIWALSLLGLLTAVLNKRKIFNFYFILFVLFAVVAMVDFYRWEYNYGHNLNPTAPIQVPGMAYQPPLIGYKQLLNFSAYSIPDTGGWVFIGSGVLFCLVLLLEWIQKRREKKTASPEIRLAATAVIISVVFSLLGCTAEPQTIRFGKDGCDHCKMTIMDKKFGGEIVTDKGKIFRFDDVRCMIEFSTTENSIDKKTASYYLLDYAGNGGFIKSDLAFLMKTDKVRSPMGGNIVAFKDEQSRQKAMTELNGTAVNWPELIK